MSQITCRGILYLLPWCVYDFFAWRGRKYNLCDRPPGAKVALSARQAKNSFLTWYEVLRVVATTRNRSYVYMCNSTESCDETLKVLLKIFFRAHLRGQVFLVVCSIYKRNSRLYSVHRTVYFFQNNFLLFKKMAKKPFSSNLSSKNFLQYFDCNAIKGIFLKSLAERSHIGRMRVRQIKIQRLP